MKPSTPAPLADLYLCWSRDTLYAGFYLENSAYPEYYRTGAVPNEDRSLLQLSIGTEKTPRQFRFGSGVAPTSSNSDVSILSVPVHHSNRMIAVLRIPSRLFGKSTFSPGDPVRVNVNLESAARAYSVAWHLTSQLVTTPNQ